MCCVVGVVKNELVADVLVSPSRCDAWPEACDSKIKPALCLHRSNLIDRIEEVVISTKD